MLEEGTRISYEPAEWWTQGAETSPHGSRPQTATVKSCNRRGTSCVIELRPGETQTINLNRVQYKILDAVSGSEASQSSQQGSDADQDMDDRPSAGNSANKVPEDSVLPAGKAVRSKKRPAPMAQAHGEGSEEEEGDEVGDSELEEDDLEEDLEELPAPDALDDDTRKSVDAFLAAADEADAFSRPSLALAGLTRLATKALYDYMAASARPKTGGNRSKSSEALPELHVDGFDAEQIWGQLDGSSSVVLKQLRKRLKKLPDDVQLLDGKTESMLDELIRHSRGQSDTDQEGEDSSEPSGEQEALSDEEEEEEIEKEEGRYWKVAKPKRKRKPQAAPEDEPGELLPTEDEFLRLEDMERFVQDAEEAALKAGAHDDEQQSSDDEEGDSKMEGLDLEALGSDDGESGDEDLAKREESVTDEEDAELARLLESATELAGKNAAKKGRKRRNEDDSAEDIMYEDFFGPRQRAGHAGDAEEVDGSEPTDLADFEIDEDEADRGAAEDSEEDLEDGSELQAAGSQDAALAAPEGAQLPEPPEKLSGHEQRMQRMADRARMLEAQNLTEKEWFMRGEAAAGSRPLNSALEIDLDFERSLQPPPQPTEETTASLEDLIKRRIADHQFDDPQRKGPPPDDLQKELAELDDKKSAKGLGEVYADDFVRAKTGNVLDDKDEKTRAEAKTLLKALFAKLDALSHFHFAPKPVIEDLTIRREVPALAMEEVAPQVVSEAARQLPEEVYRAPKKADAAADSELTHIERRKRRATKKRTFKKRQAQQEEEKRRKGIVSVDGSSNIIGRKSAAQDAAALAAEKKARKKKKTSVEEPASSKIKFTKSAAVFGKIQDERESKRQKSSAVKTVKSLTFKL